jgi:hypothetical protein
MQENDLVTIFGGGVDETSYRLLHDHWHARYRSLFMSVVKRDGRYILPDGWGYTHKTTSVIAVTYIPAQDMEDAPVFADHESLADEVRRAEAEGNRVVVYDMDGFELSMTEVITLDFEATPGDDDVCILP